MHIALIDDDIVFLERLKKLCNTYCKNLFKSYQIDVFSNEKKLYEEKYDVYFLDIDLGTENGIEIAKCIKDIYADSIIIFISAKSYLIFNALKVQPFYFVRKQNLEDDLKELFKLLNIYYKKTMKMITFDYYGRKTSIFLKNIHYITSFGHDISIVCDQETYTYRSSLKDVLNLIDSPVVVQVHRSYAVSMMYIKEVDKNNIILKDETCITLGKKYVDEFMFQYREYLIS